MLHTSTLQGNRPPYSMDQTLYTIDIWLRHLGLLQRPLQLAVNGHGTTYDWTFMTGKIFLLPPTFFER
jgi:hypothetical protein